MTDGEKLVNLVRDLLKAECASNTAKQLLNDCGEELRRLQEEIGELVDHHVPFVVNLDTGAFIVEIAAGFPWAVTAKPIQLYGIGERVEG